MTGQLLGGASPLVAAEYQMAILWLICATTFISTYVGETLDTAIEYDKSFIVWKQFSHNYRNLH